MASERLQCMGSCHRPGSEPMAQRHARRRQYSTARWQRRRASRSRFPICVTTVLPEGDPLPVAAVEIAGIRDRCSSFRCSRRASSSARSPSTARKCARSRTSRLSSYKLCRPGRYRHREYAAVQRIAQILAAADRDRPTYSRSSAVRHSTCSRCSTHCVKWAARLCDADQGIHLRFATANCCIVVWLATVRHPNRDRIHETEPPPA